MNEIFTPAAASHATTATPARVEVSRIGAVAALTLNRPEALNAFDDGMRQIFSAEIPLIARNPDVYVVVLRSASAKAFSAGGDVRAIVAMATQDMTAALGYFRGEYSLNWTLDCFSKPTVSLINGICMGSGAGLTLYNTHRVAGENYKFAMPEVAIGLFPDVGVSHVLANLKWPIGLYLGLTGRAIGWSDANWLGLATHCIPSQHYSWIIDKLSEAEPVDPLLDRLHEPQVIGPLQVESRWVEDTFTAGSIREIVGRLQRAQGASRVWAETAFARLSKASPLSLAITHRHICSARALDLRQTLIEDYRIAVRCLNGGDFFEGVRAALIDKDGPPRWQHGTIDAVTDHEVAAYFEPLGPEDLVLPLRTQMQLLRV